MESGSRYVLDLDKEEIDYLLLGLNGLICDSFRLGCSHQDSFIQSLFSLFYTIYNLKFS